MFLPALALALVWLILLVVVTRASDYGRERTFVGASLLAATTALVVTLAGGALHSWGVL